MAHRQDHGKQESYHVRADTSYGTTMPELPSIAEPSGLRNLDTPVAIENDFVGEKLRTSSHIYMHT